MGETMTVNAIIRKGEPSSEGYRLQATDANAIPGRLAKKGTSGGRYFQVCGDVEEPIGVLGWEATSSPERPATPTTAYAADDIATVHTGAGFIFRGHLAANQTDVVDGDRLCPAANGTLKLQTAITVTFVAIAREDKTNSGSIQRMDMEWVA